MIVGFTGPRDGLTLEQEQVVVALMRLLWDAGFRKSLHGDCIGGDARFDLIAYQIGFERLCRPCTFMDLRAFTASKEIAEPMNPMARNRLIVKDADFMIGCVPTVQPIKKGSGSWATVGFTRKAQKPLALIVPSGECEFERAGEFAHRLAEAMRR